MQSRTLIYYNEFCINGSWPIFVFYIWCIFQRPAHWPLVFRSERYMWFIRPEDGKSLAEIYPTPVCRWQVDQTCSYFADPLVQGSLNDRLQSLFHLDCCSHATYMAVLLSSLQCHYPHSRAENGRQLPQLTCHINQQVIGCLPLSACVYTCVW